MSITLEEIEVDLLNLDSYLDDLVEDADLRAKGTSIEGGMTKRKARYFIVSLLERREALLASKDAEIAALKAEQKAIFDAWNDVAVVDGFIVVSDALHFYHTVKKHIPELKEHA